MKTHVSATLVGGTLKLHEPVELPDHTAVNVTIEPVAGDSRRAAAWESLKQRIRERPVHSGGRHFTREELHERG